MLEPEILDKLKRWELRSWVQMDTNISHQVWIHIHA